MGLKKRRNPCLFPFLKERVIDALNTLIQEFAQANQQTPELIQ